MQRVTRKGLRARRYLFIVASVASLVLPGCGHTITTSVATPVVVTTPPPPRVIAQVQNFGDSITCGYIASPQDGTGNIYSNEGYAGLLDMHLGVVSSNLCRWRDEAADMARLWVYPNAKPAAGANQLYTVLIGTNDANSCGGSAGCMSNWALSLEASLAWLGLPPSDKTLASAATTTGTWAADMGFGMATSSPNATISFNVTQAVAGRPLYVAYRVFDPSATALGSATLTIDGVAVDSLSSQVSTGRALATPNGTTDTVFLESVPLGAVGTHTVKLTTSATGGFFSVLWAGASTQNYASVSGAPFLLLSQITISGAPALNATIATYNASLATIAATFAANGFSIATVPSYGVLNPATDLADNLHPNNQGHAKLAAAFENLI